MKYTIGIDLGGTTMTAGLVDEAYNIVGKITRPTRLPRPAQDLAGTGRFVPCCCQRLQD